MNNQNIQEKTRHYYGDIVRKIFIVAGIVFLIAIIRDNELLPFYMIVGVISVLLLTILAGLTNPVIENSRTKKIIIADFIISAVLFVLFEYLAISDYYEVKNLTHEFFLIRQSLAVIFLVALYYSTKTYRGLYL